MLTEIAIATLSVSYGSQAYRMWIKVVLYVL